ncbi:MAG: protein serine/threonine phosphatase 2C family protein, partial [Psychroserpens sp.]|nr:protein serine/threonine phosphatase 2C family protein [Psychroserpens sp.]
GDGRIEVPSKLDILPPQQLPPPTQIQQLSSTSKVYQHYISRSQDETPTCTAHRTAPLISNGPPANYKDFLKIQYISREQFLGATRSGHTPTFLVQYSSIPHQTTPVWLRYLITNPTSIPPHFHPHKTQFLWYIPSPLPRFSPTDIDYTLIINHFSFIFSRYISQTLTNPTAIQLIFNQNAIFDPSMQLDANARSELLQNLILEGFLMLPYAQQLQYMLRSTVIFMMRRTEDMEKPDNSTEFSNFSGETDLTPPQALQTPLFTSPTNEEFRYFIDWAQVKVRFNEETTTDPSFLDLLKIIPLSCLYTFNPWEVHQEIFLNNFRTYFQHRGGIDVHTFFNQIWVRFLKDNPQTRDCLYCVDPTFHFDANSRYRPSNNAQQSISFEPHDFGDKIECTCLKEFSAYWFQNNRDTQEDYYIAAPHYPSSRDDQFSLFIICDGHRGDHISSFACIFTTVMLHLYLKDIDDVDRGNPEYMKDFLRRFIFLIDDIQLRISHHNAKICSDQCQIYQGSTIALALLDKKFNRLYALNLGDSRLMIIDKEKEGLVESFPIHKVFVKDELDRIISGGGNLLSNRLQSSAFKGNNSSPESILNTSLDMSRSLGDFLQKCNGVIADPFINCIELTQFTKHYLFISSDGYLAPDQTIIDTIRSERNDQTTPFILQELQQTSHRTTVSDDNETVLLVDIGLLMNEYSIPNNNNRSESKCHTMTFQYGTTLRDYSFKTKTTQPLMNKYPSICSLQQVDPPKEIQSKYPEKSSTGPIDTNSPLTRQGPPWRDPMFLSLAPSISEGMWTSLNDLAGSPYSDDDLRELVALHLGDIFATNNIEFILPLFKEIVKDLFPFADYFMELHPDIAPSHSFFYMLSDSAETKRGSLKTCQSDLSLKPEFNGLSNLPTKPVEETLDTQDEAELTVLVIQEEIVPEPGCLFALGLTPDQLS